MPEKSLRHGTIESQMQLAVRFADETAAQAHKEQVPELAELYYYVAGSFDNAMTIARWSRSTEKTEPSQFVAACCYLEEYLKRAKQLLKDAPYILDTWPEDAGIAFSWKAGWSALDVALKFSEMICGVAQFGRGQGLGRGWQPLNEITTSGQQARKWRDMTIQELRTRTLPPRSQWPMWQIHRDFDSMIQKLGHEFSQATGEKQGKVRGQGEPIAEEVQRKPPLSDKAAAVLELLKGLPEHRGLTGKEILRELDARGVFTDQSTLTKSIIPALRPYGVKNKRGAGYFIAE